MSEASGHPTLADKLTRLFDTLRDADGRRFSDEQVAATVMETGGPGISANYIYLLRTGRRDNPTKRHLEALAGFFQISPAYFFDDELSAQIGDELDVLAALRDSSVRAVALRAAELGPRARSSMLAILGQLEDLERPADDDPPAAPDDAASGEGSDAADEPGETRSD